MAYSLNGSNAKIDFSIGNLVGVDGGPISVASLIKLGDATNGALAHIVNSAGSAGVFFLETFGTLNYGINSIARSVSSANLSTLGLVGNWAVLGASHVDISGAPTGHYGLLGSPLTHFTASGSLTDVSAGSAADSTFKIRVGQFLNSGSEFINGEFAVDAIWKRVLTNAEWDSLSTGNYATWQALSPDWMVEYTGIGTRTDATGGGGNELSRTGSPAISLTSDPAGFFGASGVTSSDSATLIEGTPSIATASSDSSTLTESERISVVSGDSFALTESMPAFTVKITEAFSLVEGAMSVSIKDADAFTFSDATFSAAVQEADSFGLTDTTTPRLGVTDSDSSLLTETQRGSVSASDSFTLDDTGTVRISLGVVDQFLLVDELERIGVLSTDAFILSDAVFSGKGMVAGVDTFALIEHEDVDGLPQETLAPTVPITIRLSSPSLVIKFGTPHLVITLRTPQMRIELE